MRCFMGGGSTGGDRRRRTMLLPLLIYLGFAWSIADAQEDEDLMNVIEVEVVEGQNASLPCDILPDSKEDMVYMVLWFRASSFGGKPIYTFDVRGRSLLFALHCPDNGIFGNRSTFVHVDRSAFLIITNVQYREAGLYRCRVDFKNSPTRNYQIRLIVVVPPHHMQLYDEKGLDVTGKIGPLKTGDNFTIYCEIRGGQPKPVLQWLINGMKYNDHTILQDDELTTISRISLTDANRTWLDNNVVCQAISSAKSTPSKRSAMIHMNLEPSSVTITNKKVSLSAGVEAVFTCIVRDSWPASKIEWYLDGVPYTRGWNNVTNINDSITLSQLYTKPAPIENGKRMKCQAVHPTLGNIKDDSFTLNIRHKPEMELSFGNNYERFVLKEGEDVFLECKVKSNPETNWIIWFFNGAKLEFNSLRMYATHSSLIIRNITKLDIGLYWCKSGNDLGNSTSNTFYLRVYHAPVCAQRNPVILRVTIDELLRVHCTVDADPFNLTFVWKFNNSKDKFDISSARFVNVNKVGSKTSELRFRATTERDYGTLHCFASNFIGTQKDPCMFHILPASKYAARPTAPRNCSANNNQWRDQEYISVQCLTSYDGGLRQHFTLGTVGDKKLVLYNASDAEFNDYVVWMNVSSSVLEAVKEDDVLAVYAHNIRGRSDATPLFGITIRKPPKVIEMEPSDNLLEYAAESALAALVVVAVIVAIIVAIVAFKRRRSSQSPRPKTTRPVHQTVIQLDGQGRRQTVTFPTEDPTAPAGRPDILTCPVSDGMPPAPRVILETNGIRGYRVSGVNEGASSSFNYPPTPGPSQIQDQR